MKAKEYIGGLINLRNNAAVKAALEAKLPVGYGDVVSWDDESQEEVAYKEPLGQETLSERIIALAKKAGVTEHELGACSEMLEAVNRSPFPKYYEIGRRMTSFVKRGEFIHRVAVRSIESGPEGYKIVREGPHPHFAAETLRTFERKFEVRELLLATVSDLRAKARERRSLVREAETLLGRLPAGFRLAQSARESLWELRGYALPWCRKALVDYSSGKWPESPSRENILTPKGWKWYEAGMSHGEYTFTNGMTMPAEIRREVSLLGQTGPVTEELFARLQEAGVATEPQKWGEVVSAYRVEQHRKFSRGVVEGKKAFRQKWSVHSVHSPNGGESTLYPLQSQYWGSAYHEGYSRGFRESCERFTNRLTRRYSATISLEDARNKAWQAVSNRRPN